MTQLSGVAGVRSIEACDLQHRVCYLAAGARAGSCSKVWTRTWSERPAERCRSIVAGSDSFAPDPDGIQALLVGRILADELKISAGDYVSLTSPQGNLTPFGMLPRSRRFRVAGIYDQASTTTTRTGHSSRLSRRRGLRGGRCVSLLEVRVAKLDDASAVAQNLVGRAGPGFTATTWMDENRALFPGPESGKIGDGPVHRTDHIRRRPEYPGGFDDDGDRAGAGHRRADGARHAPAPDTPDFCCFAGLAVSITGTAVGSGRWLRLCVDCGSLAVEYPLNPEIYAIPYVPFHGNGLDAIWIAAAALAISVAATIVPARAAARILPVEILRFE